MPKAAQTQEEVKQMQANILDASVKLIAEEGFSKLSMRKIAARVGMTATNLYYYFANKDEINIMIRERGFLMLYEKFLAAYNRHHSPQNRYCAIVKAFVEFGTANPDYFEIMYSLRTPKYIDYRGTKFEGAALSEKSKSTRTMQLTVTVISEMMGNHVAEDDEELKYKAIVHWSDLHGIISLYNSRLLMEVAQDAKTILDRRVDDLIDATIAWCTTNPPNDQRAISTAF